MSDFHDRGPAGPDGIRRGFPVETPVGTMYLRHVGWGVLVDNSSNTVPHREGRPYLHIGSKQFTAMIGVYPEGTIERAYVHKVGSYDDAAPTYAQRIIAAARDAALRYIAEHPEEVARGEHYRATMNLYSAQSAVDRLRPEYRAALAALRIARKSLADAEARLAAFEGNTA